MRIPLAVACHLVLLTTAYRLTYSASGFLILGLGPALLLDRYFLRLLPWKRPVVWARELALRGALFVLGSVAFYLIRPGVVPLREALFRGACTVLVVWLLEMLAASVLALMGRLAPVRSPRRRQAGVGACLAILVLWTGPYWATIHPIQTVPKRGPSALGLAYEDVHFPTTSGGDLAGWVIPHAQARGNLIFCHGHGRNRGQGAGVFRTLHELGLNVLAFDFPGHGDSVGHTATFGHREVDDLVAAAAYLEGRFPGKPLFLFGFSYGAAVALQALPQLPQVRGVWSEGSFNRFRDVVGHQFVWLPAGLRGPLLTAYHVLGWLDAGFWCPALNPIDALTGVRVPILFCHGQQDRLVPFGQAEDLYAQYTGPKSHYWVEKAAHYNVRQCCREEYLQRLRTFLQGCLAGETMPGQTVVAERR